MPNSYKEDVSLNERLKRGYIQYNPEIASYWDAIIDWDKRKKGEGDFFVNYKE